MIADLSICLTEEKNPLTDIVYETLSQSDEHRIQVYIGDESPIRYMKDCSVVTATSQLDAMFKSDEKKQ